MNSVTKLFSNYSKQIKVEIGYACNMIKTWTVKTKLKTRKCFFSFTLAYETELKYVFKAHDRFQKNNRQQYHHIMPNLSLKLSLSCLNHQQRNKNMRPLNQKYISHYYLYLVNFRLVWYIKYAIQEEKKTFDSIQCTNEETCSYTKGVTWDAALHSITLFYNISA